MSSPSPTSANPQRAATSPVKSDPKAGSDPKGLSNSEGTPASEAASWSQVIARLVRKPRFIAAVLVLLVAAIGFNTASVALQLHFRKQAVPLRVTALDDKTDGLPKLIADRWLQISEDEPLPSDVEKELGTKQYLNRTYIDLTNCDGREDAIKSNDLKRRNEALVAIRTRHPEAVISVHIAYYTGLVDTVAHIPDRCMVADGYEPTAAPTLVNGPVRGSSEDPEQVQFRYITFEDLTGRTSKLTRHVGYVFHVNGRYESNPLGVRERLQNLFEKFGYYAKVELMTQEPSPPVRDPAMEAKAAAVMTALLTDLLPEVERCLPDWKQVTGQSAGAASVPAASHESDTGAVP